MNYIFGIADLQKFVGVWSIARLTDPKKEIEFERILRITIHETGHMFYLPLCVEYRCLMNGVDSLQELDSIPLRFCPSCLKKLLWKLQISPKDWCKSMIQFYKIYEIQNEKQYYIKLLEDISSEERR